MPPNYKLISTNLSVSRQARNMTVASPAQELTGTRKAHKNWPGTVGFTQRRWIPAATVCKPTACKLEGSRPSSDGLADAGVQESTTCFLHPQRTSSRVLPESFAAACLT